MKIMYWEYPTIEEDMKMDEHELLVDLGENPWYEGIVTLLDDDDVELLREENDNE